MQTEAISKELDLIEQIIADVANGSGISKLEAALKDRNHPIPRRTLQRRIDNLLAAKRISLEGGGRSIIYKRFLHDDIVVVTPAPQTAEVESYVPLSATALQVRDAIRRPLIQRKPVGYDRGFFECYRPNQDYYLS